MKAKTELFLYHLFWTAGALARPTFRNLDESFEGWAYRNGFLRRVQRLEEERFLESKDGGDSAGRVHRLTKLGRLRALGGRDPDAQWKRTWDGKWRMVIFDLPEERRTLRNRLRRTLRAVHFGCLQQSVWITPDPVTEIQSKLKDQAVFPGVLVFVESVPCGGERAGDLVKSAWDFEEIHAAYRKLCDHLERFPARQEGEFRDRLRAWLHEEQRLWTVCMARDPLLPDELLPRTYSGKSAWRKRRKIMRKAGQLMASA